MTDLPRLSRPPHGFRLVLLLLFSLPTLLPVNSALQALKSGSSTLRRGYRDYLLSKGPHARVRLLGTRKALVRNAPLNPRWLCDASSLESVRRSDAFTGGSATSRPDQRESLEANNPGPDPGSARTAAPKGDVSMQSLPQRHTRADSGGSDWLAVSQRAQWLNKVFTAWSRSVKSSERMLFETDECEVSARPMDVDFHASERSRHFRSSSACPCSSKRVTGLHHL